MNISYSVYIKMCATTFHCIGLGKIFEEQVNCFFPVVNKRQKRTYIDNRSLKISIDHLTII